MLIEYVKNGRYDANRKNRKKKGVIVAVVCEDGIVRIGWSLCKFSAGDKFTKLGLNIAKNRAIKHTTIAPQSIIYQLEKFIGRAKKYYKDKMVEVNINNVDQYRYVK